MRLDRVQQSVLIGGRQGAQCVSQRRADPPPRQGLLSGPREACRDVRAARHPLGLAAKQPPDGGRAQPLLFAQRADHAPLIEGGEGPRRRVGGKQQPLVLLGSAGPLQDHGDPLTTALPPGLQPFEAIDELVQAVGDGYDAEGKLRDVLRRMPGRSGSQGGVAGAQALDGQPAQGPCGLLSGRLGLRHRKRSAAARSGPVGPTAQARRRGSPAPEAGFRWPTPRGPL